MRLLLPFLLGLAACARVPVGPNDAASYGEVCAQPMQGQGAREFVASSCYELGRLYAKGEGVERDPAKAAEAFGRACEGSGPGARHGCAELARLTLDGDGVEADTRGAARLYSQACALGEVEACLAAGALYDGSRGHPPRPESAVKSWQTACEGGHGEACVLWGVALAKGRGVAKDARAAAWAYEQACSLGVKEACTSP